MPIRYRYNTNQSWVYVDGDRWETKQVEPKCKGANITPYVYFDVVLNTFGFGNRSYSQLSIGEAGAEYIGFVQLNSIQVAVNYRRANGSILSKIFTPSQTGAFISVVYARIAYYYALNQNTGFLPQPWFVNNAQNSCTTAGCNFKVYSGQQVTLDITNPTCPEAEVVTQQCPPDTCSVDCGTYVCCYNAQGISTFNYTK